MVGLVGLTNKYTDTWRRESSKQTSNEERTEIICYSKQKKMNETMYLFVLFTIIGIQYLLKCFCQKLNAVKVIKEDKRHIS